MNEIANKFLLAGDKFMPEKPGFSYSARGPFTKNNDRIQKFMQTRHTRYIPWNNLEKVCFQHDVAYGTYKDLVKRTESDKVLRDRAFKIAGNPRYDGYERGLTLMDYKFFDKKSAGGRAEFIRNRQLEDEIHKSIIRKSKRPKVSSSFKDNIWGIDLADMQSTSKYSKCFRFLSYVIDLFSK